MGLLPKLDGKDSGTPEGGYKRLRDVHAHDHKHDEQCTHDQVPPTGIKGFFHRAAAYKPQIVIGSTAALLVTTALTAPLMATTLGAGLAMAAALYLLPRACDITIDSVSALGKKLKLSGVGIGLGLAMMESFPEFAVAAKSIVSGTRDVGLGNVIGSNIAHALLILGTVAAMAGVKKSQGTAWKFNVAALAGASTAFGTQLATGRLIEGLGYGMMMAAGVYLVTNYQMQRRDAQKLGLPEDDHGHHHHHHGGDHVHVERSGLMNGLLATGSMGAVIYTAHSAVEHAMTVAQNFEAPPVLLGSLALALGTSAPEFIINYKLAKQGKTETAVANVIGCSVLNVLAVGGLLAATGTPVPESLHPSTPLGLFNLAAWGTAVGLATTTLLANKGELKRWHGFAALALYGGFVFGSATLGTAQDIPEKQKPPIITPV